MFVCMLVYACESVYVCVRAHVNLLLVLMHYWDYCELMLAMGGAHRLRDLLYIETVVFILLHILKKITF